MKILQGSFKIYLQRRKLFLMSHQIKKEEKIIKIFTYWKVFFICLLFFIGVQGFSTEIQGIKKCRNGFQKQGSFSQFITQSKKIDSFESRTGFFFKNQKLKRMALNHMGKKRFSTKRHLQAKKYFHSRRLEFLGDAVFNLSVIHMLMERYTQLSRQTQHEKQKYLMSNSVQARIALLFKLDQDILFNTSRKPGDLTPQLLANVLEALVGAMYLDGGYEEAKRLVMYLLGKITKKRTVVRSNTYSNFRQVDFLNLSLYSSYMQQLKILGSYVLDLYATEILMKKYPEDSVRHLFEKRRQLKNFVDMNSFDQHFPLKDFDIRNGRSLSYTEFDNFKLLLGFMYLNGSKQKAKKMVRQLVEKASKTEFMSEIFKEEFMNGNYKDLLYVFTQRKFKKIPVYRIVEIKDPEYEKVFAIEVRIDNQILGRGKGTSKKQASQSAALSALKNFSVIPDFQLQEQ